jgi:hypothetical protein
LVSVCLKQPLNTNIAKVGGYPDGTKIDLGRGRGLVPHERWEVKTRVSGKDSQINGVQVSDLLFKRAKWLEQRHRVPLGLVAVIAVLQDAAWPRSSRQ